MHTRSLTIGVAAALFLMAACSNNSTSTSRDEADRNSANDRKSDSSAPVDAAARTSENAGKCIAGACADQSPPTSP
jgi:hypothetical protein